MKRFTFFQPKPTSLLFILLIILISATFQTLFIIPIQIPLSKFVFKLPRIYRVETLFPFCSMIVGPCQLAKYMHKAFEIRSQEKHGILFHPFTNYSLSSDADIFWYQWGIEKPEIVNQSHIFLLGPTYSPIRYFDFPKKDTYEENWTDIVKQNFIISHSERVINYMMSRTNSEEQRKRYIIVPACIQVEDKTDIIPYENRTIDVLFYRKFADESHPQESTLILDQLKAKYNVVYVKYTRFRRHKLLKLAQNTKVILYYSFYDTGAIALKEIQEFGAFALSLQSDLIDDNNGMLLTEPLNVTYVVNMVEKALNQTHDTQELHSYNHQKHSCVTALNGLEDKLIDIIEHPELY